MSGSQNPELVTPEGLESMLGQSMDVREEIVALRQRLRCDAGSLSPGTACQDSGVQHGFSDHSNWTNTGTTFANSPGDWSNFDKSF